MTLTGAWNAEYIDEQYRLWKSDPSKVSRDWQFFFEGFELAATREGEIVQVCDEDQVSSQSRVEALVYRYRDLGHLLACLDPLAACPTDHPLLNLAAFKLSEEDLNREFYTELFPGRNLAPLRDIHKALRETYCQSIGVEYMHLQDPAERSWLKERMEPVRNKPRLTNQQRIRILNKLYQASLFEQFLNRKYVGQTRFSLEGAEALIPMLDTLFGHVAAQGCQEIILGMAHRGRLNVQVNVLNKPLEEIFCEFESDYDPESIVGAGDVKYHNGYLADVKTADERTIRVLLVNNPSHLESVNPVVEGFARGRQDTLGGEDRRRLALPLLIHGDAAFAGQGVVAETLNMSQLEGYSTGGTVHLVINNQIGYTTLPEDARSTRYSTDVAKMLMVPIFHVHAENPESVIHVTKLACDYRYEFGKDVVIDLVCYRRYGHNEGDEPYFTQPLMYERIKERPELYKIYSEQLLVDGIVTPNELTEIETGIIECLDTSFQSAREKKCVLPSTKYYEEWQGIHGSYSHQRVDTAVAKNTLVSLARKLNAVPQGFSLHRTLERLLKRRLEAVETGKGIDWANAETLAFASSLEENVSVRLSGQDIRRGTFSQRHSVLFDTKTGEGYTSLNRLSPAQEAFHGYDSLLSEIGVLSFEYGYSLSQPHALIMWEAQFGDFVNNAQALIDLYLASGESKWQRLSGLVMLLPHGLEGQGPEHSSARLERFLQLCAEENIQVCNPTTPAQYFHLLRRQVKRQFRKPLVIMTPKSLLRHPLAVSNLSDFTTGSFQEILDDSLNKKDSRRILFCSGKIYYELFQRRQDLEAFDVGLVRLEQFYPFPEKQLAEVVAKYSRIKDWYWVQEEPENMGGWSFVRPRLASLVRRHIKYIGRQAAASPATGYPSVYKRQQAALVEEAVGPPPNLKEARKAQTV
ncbi:MAG: 2-oxoglutarate dehydrogenase E1 component [Deltaproteobacteria bacterium]|nr:MAG: 2-oxoglutarate dehydrogenase E1 component [Deltaproteobacteria bacterium]